MNLGATEGTAASERGLGSEKPESKQPAAIASAKLPPKYSNVRTLLVDESPAMLAMLARIIAEEPELEVVGTVTDSRKALIMAARLSPELVLMALHLPHLSSVHATRCLKKFEQPPVVFIIAPDHSCVPGRISATAGADEVIIKSEDLRAQLHTKLQKWFGLKPALAKTPNQSPDQAGDGH